jgi:prevent-host-death family protein
MNITSTELKTRLGKYLKLVQKRAKIVITDRGAPVATLSGMLGKDAEEHEDQNALAESDELQFSRIPTGSRSIRNITFPKLQKSARSSTEWLRAERGER